MEAIILNIAIFLQDTDLHPGQLRPGLDGGVAWVARASTGRAAPVPPALPHLGLPGAPL